MNSEQNMLGIKSAFALSDVNKTIAAHVHAYNGDIDQYQLLTHTYTH